MTESSPATDTAAGQRAVAQNVQALAAFLQQHAPFDAMEQAHVLFLLQHSALVFFAAGQQILGPEAPHVAHWYIVRQGHVVGQRAELAQPAEPAAPAQQQEPDTPVQLLPGDAFPFAAILGERPTRRRYSAAEDSFCLQLPVAQFVQLLELSPVFRQFALRGVSGLLARVGQHMQLGALQTLHEADALNTPLRSLITRAPLCCGPDTSVREAVGLMHSQRTSSIAITDADLRLQGIFTLRDLRALVIAPHADLDAPIGQVMTATPKALHPDDSAFDATMLMARHHFGHLCLVEDGALRGVISERDLFALQRVDLVHLARAIRSAASVPELATLRADIGRLVANMLAHGASAEQVLRIVTQLNDHSVERVIELMLAEHGEPGLPFAWLAFGSEARGEQTLLSDQDNGLLFLADGPAQAQQAQARLLPLAKAINEALHACGLHRCPGNIMASNPALCLADFQWRDFFDRMLQQAQPQDVLNATIFFDMRLAWATPSAHAPLEQAVQQLRAYSLQRLQQESAFQRLMASFALQRTPPAIGGAQGLKHRLIQALGAAQGGATLDIKKQALAICVDAVRILALAQGCSAASTVQRLRWLGERGHLRPERVQTYEDAFNFLQQLRLRHHQRQQQHGQPLDNLIALQQCHTLELRVLRAALAEAARLQDALRLNYRL
ncbi:MAG: DUF294 nucleotidyltransferase-like domain-containing protein [Comamonadaceae bacterium]|nr:DUF294 nucleotidyltransferase-like domain-containing protein [Comamonadaceae bacterium]